MSKVKRVHYNQYNYPILNFIMYFDGDRLYVPEYQRDLVWNEKQKQMLIDSIMQNLPIGNIFLNERDVMSDYEIVDGQQRLFAIWSFYNNEFKLNGRYYRDLSDVEKFEFVQFTMAVYVTRYADRKDIIELYYRINWGGIEHSLEELIKIDMMRGGD